MSRKDPIIELLTRGVQEVIVQKSLDQKLRCGEKIKLYLGIDPTGSRLHLGHAIALRKLRDFQRLGHHVVFLIGNFTALIGDTSDKDSARKPLMPEQIEENFKTYKLQASKILDFSKIELKYNADWLSKLTFREIIELASKFTVQQMIEREMYQKRIAQGKPIGLHEFIYPLMQGFDSVAMNVDLEVGGNDQLFNMLAGRTLQRVLNNREKHVMTIKILEGNDGRRMAKTYNNAIYITDEPLEQYGKTMSIKDELIIQYFELCTDVSMDEINEIKAAIESGENPRDHKMHLAKAIVTLYHGKKMADEAQQEFIRIFQKHDLPNAILQCTLPQKKYNICELLVETKMASSKSEARRLVKGGGVSVEEKKIIDQSENVNLSNTPILVKVGKRHFVRIKSQR